MGTLWFWIVAVMLVAYVVLDGFDIGVGIVYLFVARSEEERQQAMRSIGPFWDGNEVWLLAAGGTLFFAFPLLYASAFSGFYLPLMIVLWLLILRAISVELRGHSGEPLWRAFFDAVFTFSSSLLAIFYGAALANVIRGVPLGADNYFFLPLWTNWRTGAHPGILDWYTVTGGVLALVALAVHGALYLALKTEGELERRSRAFALRAWTVLLVLTLAGLPLTVLARPNSLDNYIAHPILFVIPCAVLASLMLVSLPSATLRLHRVSRLLRLPRHHDGRRRRRSLPCVAARGWRRGPEHHHRAGAGRPTPCASAWSGGTLGNPAGHPVLRHHPLALPRQGPAPRRRLRPLTRALAAPPLYTVILAQPQEFVILAQPESPSLSLSLSFGGSRGLQPPE